MKTRIGALAVVVCMVSSLFAAWVPLSDIQQRKNNKKAISLFQPWATISGGIIDTAGLHYNQKIAIHDLVHNQPAFYGLKWITTTPGDTFPGNAEAFDTASITKALKFRQQLLALNPNIILIGEVRFYDAPPGYLPDDSPYWMRKNGAYVLSSYMNYRRLDFTGLAFQTHCANQCRALLASGVVDGVFLDWAKNAHAPLFVKVRELLGNEAVIIGNVNHHYNDINLILPTLSGVYMECGWWSGYGDNPPEFFMRVRSTISQAQATVREPKLICTEIWSEKGAQDLDSTAGFLKVAAGQEHVLRAGAAVHYTHTAGYYSFYPQTFRDIYLAEHMHIYHDFFNAHLGAPIAGQPTMQNGAYLKDWENGTVVYNPPNNPEVTVTFAEDRRSQRTKVVGKTHKVPMYDGDIFLKGAYTQLYPTPAGLPSIKPLPDTTYKNQLVGVSPKGSQTVSPRSRPVKIITIVKNRQILLQKEEPGKTPQYYNTAGRQIRVIKDFEK